MSRSICFLLDGLTEQHNDNCKRLPLAFESAGWKVLRACQMHLCFDNGQVCVRIGPESLPLVDFDLVWHLGLGQKASFFDRMELLSVSRDTCFVTSPRALVLQHGKLHLLDPAHADLMPETLASADAEHLASSLNTGEWVIKPTAGSLGRGVMRVVGGSAGLTKLFREASDGGFLIAQRYVPCRDGPEVRVLFAQGEAIGSYSRIAKDGTPANLAKGATPVAYQAGPELDEKLKRVGAWLHDQGIGFAAADFRDGYLIEINIANPGGLATIEGLTGEDLSARLVQRLSARIA